MRSRPECSSASMLLLALVLCTAPGCQLNRSFFQMDSNSRVPFFGVDLAPKWPKRTSSVDGVSRLQSDSPEASATQSTPEATESPTEVPEQRALPQSSSVTTEAALDAAPVELFR